MATVNLSAVTTEARRACAELAARAGSDLDDCYQCGKCSAGCPMVEAFDKGPQEIMRLLQLGLLDQALDARSPWLCSQCAVCSERCPQSANPTEVMREVRRASEASGRKVVPESHAFENLFLGEVQLMGRSNEQYLAATYNVRSGHFLQDMLNAPKLFTKGLSGIKPAGVKDKAAVRDLMNRCEQGEEE